MNKISLYAIIVFALASCSLQQNAGGGIETTNGGLVAGHIELSDGSAARYAKIVGRFLQTPEDSVVGTADSAGNYSLRMNGKGMLSLVITDSSQGFVTNVALEGRANASSRDVQLAPVHILKGTLTCSGSPCAGTLRLPNLNIQFTTMADGSFSIPGIMQGTMILHAYASVDTFLQASIVLHSDSVVTLALSKVKQTMIENFDQGLPHNSLTLDPSEGSWYIASDTSFADGNSTLTPNCSQGSQWVWCYDTTDPYQEKSLYLDIQFGGAAQTHYEIIGMNFWQGKSTPDTARRWVNLRSMDSLAFYAKGSCAMDLQFITERRVQLGEGLQYHASFTVDSVWTRYVVYPANIQIALQGEPSWDSVANQVADIAFVIQQSCSITLDNIVIYGYWPEDLQ